MKITILEKEHETDEDEIIVRCNALDENIVALLNKFKTGPKKLNFYKSAQIMLVDPKEVFYFESVDDKTFAYTKDQVYETKQRIYQLEEELSRDDFFRASKSVIVNLNKIQSLSPAFGGRFEAVLMNGYKIIISRMYVSNLKQVLGL